MVHQETAKLLHECASLAFPVGDSFPGGRTWCCRRQIQFERQAPVAPRAGHQRKPFTSCRQAALLDTPPQFAPHLQQAALGH